MGSTNEGFWKALTKILSLSICTCNASFIIWFKVKILVEK